ncbi:MAG: transketolase C-terminal domain-containing protein, partial [Actinomycetota bacterium]
FELVSRVFGGLLRPPVDDIGLILVVEDHRIEGGLGDAVLGALAGTGMLTGRVIKLAVTDMPGSGTPEELRAWARIDADAVVETVREALRPG